MKELTTYKFSLKKKKKSRTGVRGKECKKYDSKETVKHGNNPQLIVALKLIIVKLILIHEHKLK